MAYIQKIENLNPKWIPSLNKELSISQNKKSSNKCHWKVSTPPRRSFHMSKN